MKHTSQLALLTQADRKMKEILLNLEMPFVFGDTMEGLDTESVKTLETLNFSLEKVIL